MNPVSPSVSRPARSYRTLKVCAVTATLLAAWTLLAPTASAYAPSVASGSARSYVMPGLILAGLGVASVVCLLRQAARLDQALHTLTQLEQISAQRTAACARATGRSALPVLPSPEELFGKEMDVSNANWDFIPTLSMNEKPVDLEPVASAEAEAGTEKPARQYGEAVGN